MAAAVVMGLAKMRTHSEKTMLDVMPRELKSALGQQIHLLPRRQGQPVVDESLPGLARGGPAFVARPVDAPVAESSLEGVSP